MTDVTAYAVRHDPPVLLPCPIRRDWMDATGQKYAYFCLPMNVANSSGWVLVNPSEFTATWDGSSEATGVVVKGASDCRAASHFGSGVLTFQTGYVFRTDEGYGVHARGLPNEFKDGIHPLEGVMETAWLPYPFTMNWKFTRPGTVTFAEGEPFCFITICDLGLAPGASAHRLPIAQNPVLSDEYEAWKRERDRFNVARNVDGSWEQRARWRMDYLKGQMANGTPCGSKHRTRVSVCPFRGDGE